MANPAPHQQQQLRLSMIPLAPGVPPSSSPPLHPFVDDEAVRLLGAKKRGTTVDEEEPNLIDHDNNGAGGKRQKAAASAEDDGAQQKATLLINTSNTNKNNSTLSSSLSSSNITDQQHDQNNNNNNNENDPPTKSIGNKSGKNANANGNNNEASPEGSIDDNDDSSSSVVDLLISDDHPIIRSAASGIGKPMAHSTPFWPSPAVGPSSRSVAFALKQPSAPQRNNKQLRQIIVTSTTAYSPIINGDHSSTYSSASMDSCLTLTQPNMLPPTTPLMNPGVLYRQHPLMRWASAAPLGGIGISPPLSAMLFGGGIKMESPPLELTNDETTASAGVSDGTTNDSGVSSNETHPQHSTTTSDSTKTSEEESVALLPRMPSLPPPPPVQHHEQPLPVQFQLPSVPPPVQYHHHQLLLHPINTFETLCAVPGRLTLLANQKKYRVSIGEVQRRLGAPECLNASILGGILRKAKNRDGGRMLREQLHTYGIDLPVGKRKQTQMTSFTSLVEEEAVQMACDFRSICQREYPIQAAATHAISDVQNAQDARIRHFELLYASKFLHRILEMQQKGDHAAAAQQPKLEPAAAEVVVGPLLGHEVQAGLTCFNVLTHGFGGHAFQAVLETMISVIDSALKSLT